MFLLYPIKLGILCETQLSAEDRSFHTVRDNSRGSLMMILNGTANSFVKCFNRCALMLSYPELFFGLSFLKIFVISPSSTG